MEEPWIWRFANVSCISLSSSLYFFNHSKIPYLPPSDVWSQSLSAGFVWSCTEWRHYYNLAARHPRSLPSAKQKLHDVFGWAVFHILVRTQLVLTEIFHGSLQPLQSYTQTVPHTISGHPFQFDLCWSSCHCILHKPKDMTKKPCLKFQAYYVVAVGRHLHLLRYFNLSVRQKLYVCYLNLLQHSDIYICTVYCNIQ